MTGSPPSLPATPTGPQTQSTPGGAERDSLESSASLGLSKEEFRAQLPDVKRDVGFSVMDVPQDMANSLKTLGVKCPPANPGQVRREKAVSLDIEMEDDFSKERYRHSAANHTTFVQGLSRLPFNIYECTPFLDYVKASGFDFASKLPDQTELQKCLDLRKSDYPNYLARATAHHAELSEALQAVKKEARKGKKRGKKESAKEEEEKVEAEEDDSGDVAEGEGEEAKPAGNIGLESTKSLAAIWREPLEPWQVTFPIIDPRPKAVSNRAVNAANSKAKAEANRNAKQTSAKVAKPSIPAPPGFKPMGPPQIPSPSQVVTLYGCDAKDLPPPVVQFYNMALRLVYNAFANALENVAGDKDELNGNLDGRKRERRASQDLRKKTYAVSTQSELEAFRAVFGDWAVIEVLGDLEWAERPPAASSMVPGYSESLKMVNTAFKASFRSRDDSRYESILKVDSQAMAYIPTLETADFISSMTRQDVRNWLDIMISLELKYIHLNTTATPRFVEVMSAFLKKCSHYDLLSHQEWNRMDNEERERAWAIRQGIASKLPAVW